MPVDINRLTDGWLELESDPGKYPHLNLTCKRRILLSSEFLQYPLFNLIFRPFHTSFGGLWSERCSS